MRNNAGVQKLRRKLRTTSETKMNSQISEDLQIQPSVSQRSWHMLWLCASVRPVARRSVCVSAVARLPSDLTVLASARILLCLSESFGKRSCVEENRLSAIAVEREHDRTESKLFGNLHGTQRA